MDRLPSPRGPVSEALIGALATGGRPHDPVPVGDLLADDDLHLALHLAYALHFRGLVGVDDGREWDPDLIRFRQTLEAAFESELRAHVGMISAPGTPEETSRALVALAEDDGGPPFGRYLARRADRGQFEEFVIHRSIYTLKEADPHS